MILLSADDDGRGELVLFKNLGILKKTSLIIMASSFIGMPSLGYASEGGVYEHNLADSSGGVEIKDLRLSFRHPEGDQRLCRNRVCKFDIFINNKKIITTMLNNTMSIFYYEKKSVLYIKISKHNKEYFGDVFISVCQRSEKSCECALDPEAAEIARRKDFPEIDVDNRRVDLGVKNCAYAASKTQWR